MTHAIIRPAMLETNGLAPAAPGFEVVVGLEVHAQLQTASKMFCGCSAAYQELEPNTDVCPVCMGMPGVLPIPNQRAVEHVVRTGLALGCSIARETKFDRKNYPYPDLMKGYQISQHDRPIATRGSLTVLTEDGGREVGINRVHLEEDVAKLVHRTDESGSYSLLDINRSGVPLMEIVSEPDMRSAEEAREYLTSLRSILRYLGVSTANMEEGSFRCDANISVRTAGQKELGPKVEIKNMNSFKSVYSALLFEVERQTSLAASGVRVKQETRGWSDARGETFSQRSKEDAHDYRYFPEPDIPPFVIDPAWVSAIQSEMPELPAARRARFERVFELSAYEAGLLTSSRDMADYFEAAVGSAGESRGAAKAVSNWMLGELSYLMNSAGMEIGQVSVAPDQLPALQGMVDEGTLSLGMAKSVLTDMFKSGRPARETAEALGMAQVSDEDSIREAVREAVETNPKAVDDYLGGKSSAAKFLVGQVMKVTRGKANPKVAAQLLEERLDQIKGA